MITITHKQGNKFELEVSNSERDTIEYLIEEFPRKLEQFIETYLAERKRNREAAEDMEIVSTMTVEERDTKRTELRASKREARRIARESNG